MGEVKDWRRGRWLKVKDILDIISLFVDAVSVEEINEPLLVKSIKNPSVPWIFCEIIAIAHPEQINQISSGQLPIYCVNPKSKQEHYKGESYYSDDSSLEEECLETEELELTRFLFRLLKENP